jgi:hypothetical protein
MNWQSPQEMPEPLIYALSAADLAQFDIEGWRERQAGGYAVLMPSPIGDVHIERIGTVYVVECGVYAERYIEGVYNSLDAAKAGHVTGKSGWRDLGDDEWDNGLDMGDAVLIMSYDVSE